ncbi:Por secretion system C-terminal sorting domain-containing protein [Bacteroides luti]|uniref:Por secretion system C-terminal sorting domain-containing protein n=1 Tax=Bacteroides luti TaxID=1297750 RepID=A0A1M5A7N5_9BACE|nr:T9SS type A sorting domain-containing protein [Bacteroides luti]SHF25852.1 Por secretion system C-terminal sorting domain-containing protein [Bacteroides luti]
MKKSAAFINISFSLDMNMTNMKYNINNMYSYYRNLGNHINCKPAMICMDTVHLVNEGMRKDSIIINEIKPNATLFQGHDVKVYPRSEDNSLLIEITGMSKNIKATVYLFSLEGTLLQMNNVSQTKTIIDVPSMPNGRYLMNIQIGKDILTWKITKQ